MAISGKERGLRAERFLCRATCRVEQLRLGSASNLLAEDALLARGSCKRVAPSLVKSDSLPGSVVAFVPRSVLRPILRASCLEVHSRALDLPVPWTPS